MCIVTWLALKWEEQKLLFHLELLGQNLLRKLKELGEMPWASLALLPASPWLPGCSAASFPALTPNQFLKSFLLWLPLSGEDLNLNILRILPFAKQVLFISLIFRCTVSFQVKIPGEVSISILNSYHLLKWLYSSYIDHFKDNIYLSLKIYIYKRERQTDTLGI